VISNKEYTALIIVSASWVYFVGLLPDGGDIRINACRNNDQGIEKI
jgi:hypothetical protein